MVGVTLDVAVRPVRIGPEGYPDFTRTLGIEADLWAHTYLQQPDGPNAGQPWEFTPEQRRFLLWFYAVDGAGRFQYRSAVYRRMKGAGKNPFAAALSCIEFVGPCRFGGWREDGTPIAIPNPAAWVQIAAVSRDQTRNSMTLFPSLLSKRAITEYGIDLGKEIIYAEKGRRRLESVTSSPRAMEGGRATFSVLDETHHWLEHNEGHAMAAVIARNLAKSRDGSARSLAITNAHNPGEDSVAERDWDAYEKVLAGTTKATGILYDSLEAPPDTVMADRDSLRAGILAARGDSDWLDVDRLIEEIYDPRTLPSVARRFYLNQIVASEDAWITPQEWDAAAAPAHEVPAGAAITLGFDGSRSDDHTALVACEVETGHLFTPSKVDGKPSVWNPADYGHDLPRAEIDATVRRMFEQYDVVGFYSDYSPFESYVDRWEEDLAAKLCVSAAPHHPVRWDFRTRQRDAALSAESLHEAIVAGNITHDGSPLARWYVLNARSRLTNYGVTFGKGNASSPDKVDWLAAAMVARQARQDYIALPAGKKRTKARKARFYNFAESGATE